MMRVKHERSVKTGIFLQILNCTEIPHELSHPF